MQRLSTLLIPTLFLGILGGCDILWESPSPQTDLGYTQPAVPSDITPTSPLRPFNLSRYPAIKGHSGTILSIQPVFGEVAAPTNFDQSSSVTEAPTQVLTLGADGAVIAWDLNSGRAHLIKRIGSSDSQGGTHGISLGVLAGSHPLVAYAVDGKITVECIADCTFSRTLTRLHPRPRAMMFHADDQAVLVGAIDSRVYRWKFLAEAQAQSVKEEEKCFERYAAHQTVVSAVAAHPFNRVFFSADWAGVLFGWLSYDSDDYGAEYKRNLFRGRFFGLPGTFTKAERAVDRGISTLAVSQNGEVLGVGTEDGNVEAWTVRGFERVARKQIHSGRVESIDLNTDGSLIVSAGKDGITSVDQLTDDPTYRIAPDTLRKKLDNKSHYELPGVALVRFIDNARVVGATSDGGLLEIASEGTPLVATPTPTPPLLLPTEVDPDY